MRYGLRDVRFDLGFDYRTTIFRLTGYRATWSGNVDRKLEDLGIKDIAFRRFLERHCMPKPVRYNARGEAYYYTRDILRLLRKAGVFERCYFCGNRKARCICEDWFTAEQQYERWKKADRPYGGRATYFIQHPVTGRVKIGRAGNVESRLRHLSRGASVKLRLLGVIYEDVEAEWHRRFDEYRVRGEWFEPAEELMQAISAEAERSGQTPPD